MKGYPLKARAPAYGVQWAIDGDDIVIKASDSGGLGFPRSAFVVPVREQDGRLLFVIPDRTTLEPGQIDEGGLLKNIIDRKSSPYLLRFKLSNWPEYADTVVIFLIYEQVGDAGGLSRLPTAAVLERRSKGTQEQKGPPDQRREELIAIKDALREDSMETLRGGLIRGTRKQASYSQVLNAGKQGETPLTFALASCQYPSDFLDRMPEGECATWGPADASLLALGQLMDQATDRPTLLLLAGDQVYVDATAGLFDPRVQDDRFRIPYEHRGESRGAQAVMQRLDLTVEMMLDDHEIRDNWAMPDPKYAKSTDEDLEEGLKAYFKYQRGLTSPHRNQVWRDDLFHNDIPFFLCDVRTRREERRVSNWDTAEIMDEPQFRALCEWMVKHKERPKFVLTSSAVLPRRLEVAQDAVCALHSDAWDGYPQSMHKLLAFIYENNVQGLVFLSGDEHISSLVTARVTKTNPVTNEESGGSCTFYCVHSSALYAPYPFANGRPEYFQANETFQFSSPKIKENAWKGTYSCEVQTVFAPGDGFAILTAWDKGGGWHMKVTFHDANGVKEYDESSEFSAEHPNLTLL
jgi:hypothetical protein